MRADKQQHDRDQQTADGYKPRYSVKGRYRELICFIRKPLARIGNLFINFIFVCF